MEVQEQEFTYEKEGSERLDRVLADAMPDQSRSWVKQSIGRGAVTVNGRPASKAGQKIRRGDVVGVAGVRAAQEQREQREAAQLEPNAAMPLDLLYEDDAVVVLIKPKGCVVHPSRENGRNFNDSLCSALLARYGPNGLAPCDDGLRPGIVHRLDVDTSGVMVVARTAQALEHLKRQFADEKDQMERTYVALVAGNFGRQRNGTIDAPIGRHPKHGTKRCVRDLNDASQAKMQHVKSAITHWELVEEYADGRVGFVECRLDTGRTHQIRVHLKHIHHPLLCDPLYPAGGMPAASLEPSLQRILDKHKVIGQFLHAKSLKFIHPVTNKPMKFDASLPPYWQEAIDFLKQA